MVLRRNRQQISLDIQLAEQLSPENTECDVPHQEMLPPVIPDVPHQMLPQEVFCPQPDKSTGTSFCEAIPVPSTNRREGMPRDLVDP